ncbi:MAG TPA: hypothetical protein VGB38_01735 [bacterium]
MKPIRMGIVVAFLFYASIGLAQTVAVVPPIPVWWGNAWGIDARDRAMGQATSAVGGDYSALHTNPAGLGTVEYGEINGTLSRLSVSNRADFLGKENTEQIDPVNLNALGFTYPVPTARGSLVLAFGYHRVRQFDNGLFASKFISTPNDSVTWALSQSEKGWMSNTSVGGAVEVAPGVFLGGSIRFWGGKNDFTWLFQEMDQPYNLYRFSQFDSTDHIATTFSGANLMIGALFRAPHIRIGGSVATPFTLKCRENWNYRDVTTDDGGNVEINAEDSGSSEYRIAIPLALRGGAAFEAGPVMVSCDAELIQYNQIEYRSDPPSLSQTQATANMAIQRNLRNVMNLHFGAECSVPGSPLRLRAGYGIARTPFKNALYEKDREIFSIGAGYTFADRFVLDAAFAQTEWNGEPDSNDDPSKNLIRSQKLEAIQFYLSVAYRL